MASFVGGVDAVNKDDELVDGDVTELSVTKSSASTSEFEVLLLLLRLLG